MRGSISAILLATPRGTAAAAATADRRLFMASTGQGRTRRSGDFADSSTVGGGSRRLALLLLAMPLASLALKFGPAGYFAVGVFGLSSVAHCPRFAGSRVLPVPPSVLRWRRWA
ncbi:hypothetical protein F2981_15155 [Sinorhizobium meliloti]|nr:hypothetical protein [Sinorhizobium meliloti]